jgi:hypothetical protein
MTEVDPYITGQEAKDWIASKDVPDWFLYTHNDLDAIWWGSHLGQALLLCAAQSEGDQVCNLRSVYSLLSRRFNRMKDAIPEDKAQEYADERMDSV